MQQPFERQRELKPTLFRDRRLARATILAQLVFLKLGWYADDAGRQSVDGTYMRNLLLPASVDVTTAEFEEALLELDELDLIEVYAIGPETYSQIREWDRWWKVDRPSTSVIPPPTIRESSRPIASDRDASGSFVAVEGGSESDGAGGPREADPDARPDPFCKAHPIGTDEDCRSCGRARLRLEKWHNERRNTR